MPLTSWIRAKLRAPRRDATLAEPMQSPSPILETPAAQVTRDLIAESLEKQGRYEAKRRAWAAQAAAALARRDAAMDAKASAAPNKEPENA